MSTIYAVISNKNIVWLLQNTHLSKTTLTSNFITNKIIESNEYHFVFYSYVDQQLSRFIHSINF